MQKHKINCQHCGQEFESSRSDAMYCSNSCKTRASQIKSNKNPVVKISYKQQEFEDLSETAKGFDLTVEELIKLRGMITNDDLNQADGTNKEMVKEIKRLKAELSMYKKTPSAGIFLDLSDNQKLNLNNKISDSSLLNKIEGGLTNKILAAVLSFCEMEKVMNGLDMELMNMRLDLKTVTIP